jgi:terminase small subunit / prophage DNA-packing protein
LLIQKEIAEHLDLSQPAVCQWLERLAIDWKNATLDKIRVAYIRSLREQAAGRATTGDLDLATERARLAKEQADRVAMQNAIMRAELTETVVLEQVLAAAASKISGILDAIPGMIRRRVMGMSASEVDMIAREVAKARNSIAAMSIADLAIDALDDPDQQPAEIS